MISHFLGHTSKIDLIYLLWKPKLPQPLIQEPISQNLPSEKKVLQKHSYHEDIECIFSYWNWKLLTPKQKKVH